MANRISETLFLVKIDATSVKAFVASLHLLQKIGRDLILEVESQVLTLRGLNDNKSSFTAVEFDQSFFDEYNLNTNAGESFSCKLPVKPICMILKNLKTIAHIVMAGVRCQAEYNITFQLHLQNTVIRSYYFCYEDCEILNAVCDEAECSLIQMRPRVMSQLLDYIHRSPEILMIAKPNDFSVRSYHQINEFSSQSLQKLQANVDNKRNAVISTGLSMNVSEFDVYDYRSEEDTEAMVFCVKEVASFVGFCEVLDLQVFNFHFSTGGSAIKLSVRLDCFSASLIMATLQHNINRDISQPAAEATSSTKSSNKRPADKTSKTKKTKQNSSDSSRNKSIPVLANREIAETLKDREKDSEEDDQDTFFDLDRNEDTNVFAAATSNNLSHADDEAEFDSGLVASSGKHVFAQKSSHLSSILQERPGFEDNDDDEATIAEEEDAHESNVNDDGHTAKRARLNQHPTHRQYYHDGLNTDDEDTEEEVEFESYHKPLVTTKPAIIDPNENDESDILVNKKKVIKGIPLSLQSSAGSDAIITAVVQQQIQQVQMKKRKGGARRLLDDSDDDSD